MTTPAVEAMYLAQHLHSVEGRDYAVYNPHNKPIEELPFIIGFNNGGSSRMLSAVAISEDGMKLGGHCCSDEGYMPHDLGVIEGSRPDRHEESYQKHYPDGYRMDFVSYGDIEQDPRLTKAFELSKQRVAEHSDENV